MRPSSDLAFALELADAADAVSMAHFRSEELRRTTKGDGTPVSQVDLAVEQAMLDRVRVAHPDDGVLGEEVGRHPGSSSRRWIFDGIDGTHNYTAGRGGWGTIIALEVDGAIAVGLVSSPVLGRRWWAERGGGACTAPTGEAPDAAAPLRCGPAGTPTPPAVLVTPFEGFLLGWRNDVTTCFAPPTDVRSQCFALDAVAVADGRLGAAVITMGGVWDFAATSLIVTEAGGVHRDAWGGTRLDTATGVFVAPDRIDTVLAVLATLRPPEPDEARLASTVSTPVGGGGADGPSEAWRRFGIRSLPSMSARVHVDNAPPMILDIVDERAAELARPLVGVTTDGVVRAGLRSPTRAAGAGTAAIGEAASAFLQALTAEQRSRATFTADAIERRTWLNVHMNHFRHGLLLEDVPSAVRELALDLLRATLSARGFHQARSIMRLNELLAELTGDRAAFGEWPYFVSVFGTPSTDAPWAWQIDGHHLCVNATMVDGRVVLTPTFMGAEPRTVRHGPYGGISLFDPEEALGLDLVRSFDPAQRARAIIHPSIHQDEIDPALQNLFDGRMQAGAFHDNLVAPYQGVPGTDLGDAQRAVLTSLVGTYAGWSTDEQARVTMSEVTAHLDETWFSWYGGTDDGAPFYYRVHSPVILIEFDHHPGVVFDNDTPTRHHVHTVVRTPNGGDYGTDLLRAHHDRFDHTEGTHRSRT